MCKHTHSTVVNATLDDGTPFRVHQCDMCGLAIPGRAVKEEETDIEIDWQALQEGLDKLFAPLMKGKKRKYERRPGHRKAGETIRTATDFAAGYANDDGMSARLSGITFRIEIRSGQAVTIAEPRYLLR